jgi:hypothetical protein
MPPMATTDDGRSLAQHAPPVEARLAPERQRADLVVLGRQLDALVDPTTRPQAVSGAGRAARRRGETP